MNLLIHWREFIHQWPHKNPKARLGWLLILGSLSVLIVMLCMAREWLSEELISFDKFLEGPFLGTLTVFLLLVMAGGYLLHITHEAESTFIKFFYVPATMLTLAIIPFGSRVPATCGMLTIWIWFASIFISTNIDPSSAWIRTPICITFSVTSGCILVAMASGIQTLHKIHQLNEYLNANPTLSGQTVNTIQAPKVHWFALDTIGAMGFSLAFLGLMVIIRFGKTAQLKSQIEAGS